MHTENSGGADEGMSLAAVDNIAAFPTSGTLQLSRLCQISNGIELRYVFLVFWLSADCSNVSTTITNTTITNTNNIMLQ